MFLPSAAVISFSLLAVTRVRAYQGYYDQQDLVEVKKFLDGEQGLQDVGFFNDANDLSNVVWLKDAEGFIRDGNNDGLTGNEALQGIFDNDETHDDVKTYDILVDVPEGNNYQDVTAEKTNRIVQHKNGKFEENTAGLLHVPIRGPGSGGSRYKLPVWQEGLKRSDLRQRNGGGRQILGTLRIDGDFYVNGGILRPAGRVWMKSVHRDGFGGPALSRRSNSNSNMNFNQNVNRNFNG